jgi:hypothetical protein
VTITVGLDGESVFNVKCRVARARRTLTLLATSKGNSVR